MLNPPTPAAGLPLELTVLTAPESVSTGVPPLAGFAALLGGCTAPVAGAGETGESVGQDVDETAAPESPGPDSPPAPDWALLLVPELATLPLPPAPPPALDAAAAPSADPWPIGASGVRLVPAGRPRLPDWRASLPAPPPRVSTPLPALPATPPVLRNVTGQPIPYPAADLPPWYDPQVPPPWFDPANPPPAWGDPTRPPPTWFDPTRLPPAWMDPARIPAAWFGAPPVADAPPPAPQSAGPATPGLSPLPAAQSLTPAPSATVPPAQPSPVTAGAPRLALPPVAEAMPKLAPDPRRPPAAHPVFEAAPEATPQAAPVPPAALAAIAPPAAPLQPAPAPPAPHGHAPPSAAAHTAADPALAIASERLGEVAVRLSGNADQLQVSMTAQPAAAALIGAEAPRLSQDLAAAGVALAGLSVNGQRADLAGGQRERQRPPRREPPAIAAVNGSTRRSAAITPAITIDRFA